MDQRVRLLQYLWIFYCLWTEVAVVVSRITAITLDNNGYTGILLAIHPDVPQSMQLIDDIKAMFREASLYLYTATDKRAYFREVTLLVPSTWTANSTWASATVELYNNADVVVLNSVATGGKRSFDDQAGSGSGAYTKSYGGCGQSGVRITLFTDIFEASGQSKYGPAGRVFVHQWAHFRWGVFDEFPEKGEPQFYFSPSTGRLEGVRCNINIAGTRQDLQTGQFCQQVNPVTGLYNPDCAFIPYTDGHLKNNITASIMDRQNIPSIINFCNDDHGDPLKIHNYESPSPHNRLCGSRSTWTIISDSVDFLAGRNPPRDINDMSPTFKIVRLAATKRMVLAIDDSASMQADGKLRRARQAAVTFIEDGIDDGTYLAVISFSMIAQVVSPMTKITCDESRKNITQKLPTNGKGETSIGSALLKSIEVLHSHDGNATDAFIVLITDGQETSTPTINDVLINMKEAGAVVSVIVLSDDEDRSLENLASLTGGKYYFDTGQRMSVFAMEAMLDVYSLFDTGMGQRPVQILSQASLLSSQELLAGRFIVDTSLGQNTRIIITYTSDNPPITEVTSPSGRLYSSLYPEYSNDQLLKRVKITIPSFAETGRWTYSLTNKERDYQQVSIMVLSSAKDPTIPTLKFSGDILVENNTWPIRSTIIAEVTHGDFPVKDLKVKAIVTRPMASQYVLELFDQGAGADTVKNDGIYSRYFTKFSVSGHYSVSIEMTNRDGDVVLSGGMDVENSHIAMAYAGSVHIEHPKLPLANSQLTSTIVDDYPPMRITDLRVLRTSHANGTIILAWTAPGDDGDFDKASYYTLVMSPTAEALVMDEDLPAVDNSLVVKGNLNSPKPFGEKEEIQLKVNVPLTSNASMVFAVFAVDESSNKGKLSNLVTVGFGYVPDVVTEEYLQEVVNGSHINPKDPPKHQKVVIASVVGCATGLLAITLIVTVIIHLLSERNKLKLHREKFYGKRSQVV